MVGKIFASLFDLFIYSGFIFWATKKIFALVKISQKMELHQKLYLPILALVLGFIFGLLVGDIYHRLV